MLAVAGATLTGGIVSYSVAVASPVTESPGVRAEVAPEGRSSDCLGSVPDLNWYRQRGDQMTSNQMLPDTVSFRTGSVELLQGVPNPCGGGGAEPSCLSDFGFDPDDYWAVLANTSVGATSATVFAAPVDTLDALSLNDIPTTTGCDVTYEWTFSDVNLPFAGIIDYWNGEGASTAVIGATSTSMTVSGLDSSEDWSAGAVYNLYLCTGNLALRVSDGIDVYDITAPPCSYYRFGFKLLTVGATLEYDYQDPWARPQSTVTDGLIGAIIPTVKPSSPLTVTFKVAAPYTLKTGDDYTENCTYPLVSPTIFSEQPKNVDDEWTDPSPAYERIYCIEQIPSSGGYLGDI